MASRQGPVEQMTQAPGEFRTISSGSMTEKVAAIRCAQRLLDECNGDLNRAHTLLDAVANG